MPKLDEELLLLYEEINRKQKVKSHLKHLQQVLQVREAELADIQQKTKSIEAEIDQLEEVNIHSVFLFLLGDKKEQLEKKRQDNVYLYMRLNGLKSGIASIKEEIDLMQKALSGMHGIEDTFEQLLDRKEDRLLQMNQLPDELKKHVRRLANFKRKINEMGKIVKKGTYAKKALQKVILGFDKIEDWGNKKNLRRPKNIQKAIERVNTDIYIANNKLQNYEDLLFEISDEMDVSFQKEAEALEIFLDQLIDCLITDWIVKSNIDNAQNLVLNIFDKITLINRMFEHEQDQVKRYVEEEEMAKARVLMGSRY